jgi:hypothetical protein
MLTTTDLVRLPFTPNLTQAGIAYACRSLAFTYDRMGGSPHERLRRIAAGVAVELAFKRHLSAQEVPFDTLGMTPFTDPDHYDVALGGRRCDLKSFLLFEKDAIHSLRQDPGWLLEAAALVPSDQLASDHFQEKDLYLFAFAAARVTRTRSELERVLQSGQPVCFVYPFPAAWSRPTSWNSLGDLALKSEAEESLSLELGGQGVDRSFQAERLQLPPRLRVPAGREYYSLSYLRAGHIPAGRVGLHSPTLKKTHLVAPKAWDNIWVYGLEITLAGYMPCGEFRRRSRALPAGSRVRQYPRTRTENHTLSIAELYPLNDLFRRVKAWRAGNS